jgi:hypothetical protein
MTSTGEDGNGESEHAQSERVSAAVALEQMIVRYGPLISESQRAPFTTKTRIAGASHAM